MLGPENQRATTARAQGLFGGPERVRRFLRFQP